MIGVTSLRGAWPMVRVPSTLSRITGASGHRAARFCVPNRRISLILGDHRAQGNARLSSGGDRMAAVRARFLKERYGGYFHRDIPSEDGELTHVGPGTPGGE